MPLNLPGPVIAVDTITSTSITVRFTAPPGVTVDEHWLTWMCMDEGCSQTLVGPAAVDDSLTFTVSDDKFIVAVGFTYAVGGAIHGPSNVLAFSAPHDVFPLFEANHNAIQGILGRLRDKLTIEEYRQYSTLVDSRLEDIESNQKTLSTRIRELMGAVQAALKRLVNP